jgi:hypothetical protein
MDSLLFCNCMRSGSMAPACTMDPARRRVSSNVTERAAFRTSSLGLQGKRTTMGMAQLRGDFRVVEVPLAI